MESENDPSWRQRDNILVNAIVADRNRGTWTGIRGGWDAGVNTKKEAVVSSLALGCTFSSVGPPATWTAQLLCNVIDALKGSMGSSGHAAWGQAATGQNRWRGSTRTPSSQQKVCPWAQGATRSGSNESRLPLAQPLHSSWARLHVTCSIFHNHLSDCTLSFGAAFKRPGPSTILPLPVDARCPASVGQLLI